MPFTIVCDNCEYSRSSDADGRQFQEVCSICYTEECRFGQQPGNRVLICKECYDEEHTEPVIDPGESLLT